jgi:hypothetical protein
MKFIKRPVAATIGFGLICGLSFIPVFLALNTMVSRSNAFCLTIWLFAAGYALLLNSWSRQQFSTIVFPMLVLLLAAFLMNSTAAFFLMVLAVTGWIRSGICFPQRQGIKLPVEFLFVAVGGALAALCAPGALFGWALGVWMFFLLQSLYFVIFENRTIAPETKCRFEIDPFERASRQAEAVLENWDSA